MPDKVVIVRIRYKDYGIVLITNIMCSLVIFIYNIYMRRCIQPYDIGIYTSINLIITYLGYAQLGVLNAYNRDYPQYLGSNQHNKEVIHLRNVVFTYILLLYGFIVLIFGIAGYAYKDNNELYGQGLLFVGVIAFGNSLFTFFDFTLKSEKQFVRGAFIYLFKTIVLFCSGLILLKKFGYLGIYLALLVSIICMIVLNIPLILKLRIRIDFVLIKSLILSGITLLLNNLVWTLMQSIDRFVILNFMDMEQLGIYSVALLGFSTMVLIPQSLSQIFYVKMSRLYGQLGDRDELMNSASRFTAITGIVTALAAVVAYFLLPLFIKNIMPMYADCVKATQIIVLGVAIYGSTMLYGNILSILKKNRKLMTSTAFLCCINFGLSS